MKKYFRYFALFLLLVGAGACQKVFSSSGYPPDMPPLDQFLLLGPKGLECGRIQTVKSFKVGSEDLWFVMYIDESKYPYFIGHVVTAQGGLVVLVQSVWIDADRNGTVDEKFLVPGGFISKYGSVCNLVRSLP